MHVWLRESETGGREREERTTSVYVLGYEHQQESLHRWETHYTSSLILQLILQTVCLLAGMFSTSLCW